MANLGKILIFWACFLSIATGLRAGDEVGVQDVINRFNRRYPQERVFLHFDNTAYFENEIVWFKAYLLRTDNDRLGSLSKVLYVELVNPNGQVVETKKCMIENGVANGEFLLQRHADGDGFYQVRAYTRYMLNWGNDCVFSRVIPVFRQSAEKGDYSKRSIRMMGNSVFGGNALTGNEADTSRITVNFFPEGGQLVKGLESMVAFEVVNGKGQQVEAQGWLKVGKEQKAPVATIREGRGVFSYTPTDGDASLELTFDNGKTHTYKLPQVSETGFVIRVDALQPNCVTWTVEKTQNVSNLATRTLLVHNGKATTVSSPLLRSDMPEGCSQLSLVDRNGAVLCSRMVFNFSGKHIGNISVTAQDSTAWPDKTISLDVKAEKFASVSMSVCDAETQLAAEAHNAATWLLLSSDLKGYIRNPEFYFESNDSVHLQAADLLMMVQGWRRYDIEAMDGLTEWTKRYPVEKQLLIDGQLRSYSRRNKVNGANLSIDMNSRLGSRLTGEVTTDSTGYYVFTVPDCWGTWDMLMHTTLNDKDKRYYITVNRHFSPEVQGLSWYEANETSSITPDITFVTDQAHIDSIPMNLRVIWLQEVNVEAKRLWRNPRDFWEREDVGAKYASVKYNLIHVADELADKGEEPPTIIDWLKSKNPLFDGYDNISGEEAKGDPYSGLYGDGPTYGGKGIMWMANNTFVCGTSVPRAKGRNPAASSEGAYNKYIPFDISNVRSIYISNAKDDWKRFLHAENLEGKGLVSVFVYYYYGDARKLPKGYRRTNFEGYSFPEDYRQLMSLTGSDLAGADYRRTLYWNPDVRLDSDGNATISFKNNSTSRHMTVSAMGFTQDGKPLRMK